MTNTDLPKGYRWATETETEQLGSGLLIPGAILVPLTTDVNGVLYTGGEADIAVPLAL